MDGAENASTGKADVARDVIKSELSRTVAAPGTGCPPNVKVTSPAFTTMMSSRLDQRSPVDLMTITMIVVVMMVEVKKQVMFLAIMTSENQRSTLWAYQS